MHKPNLPTLTIAALVITSFASAATPDFSGEWHFLPDKSKNIGMMAQMKLTAKVHQTADSLVVTSVSVFNGAEQTMENRFDLGGKAMENMNYMNAKAETVSRWQDGRLVTTWTAPGSIAGTQDIRIETRYLSADGRFMTVEMAREKGSTVVMVFERK